MSLTEEYKKLLSFNALKKDYLELGARKSLPPQILSADAIKDKIKGALYGVAIGDALGSTAEGLEVGSYSAEVYSPRFITSQEELGMFTDDSQMTLMLFESLIEEQGLNPQALVKKFSSEHIRGIGAATMEFVANANNKKKKWYRLGVPSAGNGVAMRSAPVGVYYFKDFEDLKIASIIQSAITHNDPMAIASGLIVAYAVARLIIMRPDELETAEQRIYFCEDLAESIAGFEDGENYKTRGIPQPYTLRQRIQKDIPDLLKESATPDIAGKLFSSGAYVLESLPYSLYCFLHSPNDFKNVLLNSVNYSLDSDTCGAMAASFAGAFNGASQIDEYYKSNLEIKERLDSALKNFFVNRDF